MKQYKINKAYPALMRLADFRLPINKARKLYDITNCLAEHFKFALSEERKYIEDCNGTSNDDGTVSFPSPEYFGQYQEKMIELNELEIDINIDPVILTESEIGNQTISISDIRNLEGFVSFE